MADWVDVVTVHTLPGPGTLDAIAGSTQHLTTLFLIPQLSSRGALTTDAYSAHTYHMLRTCQQAHPGKICGVITQKRLDTKHRDDTLVYAMPGVRLPEVVAVAGMNRTLGQQYKTPRDAIVRDGADAIIVGSGILHASDRERAAQSYRQAGWQAYSARTKRMA